MLGNGRAAETFEYIFTLCRLITDSAAHRQMGFPEAGHRSPNPGGRRLGSLIDPLLPIANVRYGSLRYRETLG